MTKKIILGCLRVPPVEYHWPIERITHYVGFSLFTKRTVDHITQNYWAGLLLL
jgi:hypothetical protein